MNKKTIIIAVAVSALSLGVIWALISARPKTPLISPSTIINSSEEKTQASEVSAVLKTYSDESGFSFSYPDNLSILNNQLKDSSSYAELQLTHEAATGSLSLKIADSKLKSIEGWVAENKADSQIIKGVKLGNLNGVEINGLDKIMLGAFDSGVLFTIEAPQTDFWKDVYNGVLGSFEFVSEPEKAQVKNEVVSEDYSADVSFEGEEVVE